MLPFTVLAWDDVVRPITGKYTLAADILVFTTETYMPWFLGEYVKDLCISDKEFGVRLSSACFIYISPKEPVSGLYTYAFILMRRKEGDPDPKIEPTFPQ